MMFKYRIWNVFTTRDNISGIRLTLFLEKMGPTFIKLGQTLSTRPDILGKDVCNALAKLRDQVKPFSIKKVRSSIKKEFRLSAEEVFEKFEYNPIAAASVAQVHKAILKSGEVVAVKVRRPKIEQIIKKDIKFFFTLAKLIEKVFPSTRRLKPIEVIRLFAQNMQIELDFRIEAAAASQLKDNLINDHNVYVPVIYWQYTSKAILVMEWIEGIPISDINNLRANNCNLKEIAKNLAISFFNQAYRDGYFHGDLHPGNMLINNKNQIVFIDFGIMGWLDKKTKLYVAEILKGFLQRDYLHVAKIHFDAGYVPAHQSISLFTQACRAIGEPIVGKSIKQISIASLLSQLFDVTKQFEMETQPQLLLLQKTMVLIEGVGSMLDPEVNLWILAEPWVQDWAVANLSLEAKIVEGAKKLGEILIDLPNILKDLSLIIKKTKMEKTSDFTVKTNEEKD